MQDNLPKAPVEQVGETRPSFNAADAAKSPYGDLEVTKYLYESGLQNIFNSYQQSVATLDQNKQQELQDAYYIREMSKKYLGEYASNVGIGDVSGNLLDIYGQYQSNLTNIERNYDQLEMGLDQQFQQQRQETMNNLLLTEYNIEVAKLNEADKATLFNIEMGNIPEGMTDMEYLQQEYDAGRISQETYQQASVNLMNNQRTAEERALWGQIVRGELDKDQLTEAYEAGQISVEAYNQYFNAMEQQERQGVVSNIEFNIQQNQMDGLSTRDYLQQQLDNGTITDTEYQQLISTYAGDPRVETYNEVQFNILNQSVPEGFENSKAYIEANRDALGEDAYRQLMLGETLKEQDVEAFTLYQNIINDTLPEGTTAADAIEQGVSDGLFTFEQAEALYTEVNKKITAKAYGDIVFALSMGETNGLSNEEYINQVYASGESGLTEDQYRSLILEERNKELQKEAVSYVFKLYDEDFGDMTKEEFVDFGIEKGFLTAETAADYLLSEREQEQSELFQSSYNSVSEGTADRESLIADGLSESEADAIINVVSQETANSAIDALRGFYGGEQGTFGLDANGKLITDPEVYIESIKDKLTESDFRKIQDIISVQTQVANKQNYETQNVQYSLTQGSYTMLNENGEVVTKTNPLAQTFLQLGITDFSYLSNEDFSADDIIYFGVGSQPPSPYLVSTDTSLISQQDMLKYQEEETLVSGEVYDYEDGEKYLFKDGEFYLLKESTIDPNSLNNILNQTELGLFNFGKEGSKSGTNWSWDGNGGKLDTFTYNGVEYIEDRNDWRSSGADDGIEKEVVKEFERVYGETESGTTLVLFFKGSFYLKDSKGKFQKLIKKV
jgi:hypothetical protein